MKGSKVKFSMRDLVRLINKIFFQRIVLDMIKTLQEYTDNFHVALKCLHILTNDLPQSPLGKHVSKYKIFNYFP